MDAKCFLRSKICRLGLALACIVSAAHAQDEFVGPFASWANVKISYGARGDGTTDDTAALQRALNDVGTSGKPSVLYLPAGTYRITSTLQFANRSGVAFIGEDSARTVLRWDGSTGGTMMLASGVTLSRWARITWDGARRAGVGVDIGMHSHGETFPVNFA